MLPSFIKFNKLLFLEDENEELEAGVEEEVDREDEQEEDEENKYFWYSMILLMLFL